MEAIFQIRRGSGSVLTLQDGELYLHEQSRSIYVGTENATNIQLAKLDAVNTGSFNVTGDIILGGTITIGDSTSDSVIFNADLSSSIIPDATNTYDLGSTSKVYRNIYASNISASATTNFREIAQFTLTSANANTVQYGTIASGNMLYQAAQIFSNPVLAYGNNVNTTGGSTGAPGANWMVAASWNGSNTVYVYLNPSRNGTGDTGTSISMSNLSNSINQLNGSQGEGVPATITLTR
jgi:hypothetical protein